MIHQLTHQHITDSQIFQKYPKNSHTNLLYKSTQQKIDTQQDDQEIIKFPFTTQTKSTNKSSYQTSPTHRKIEKYKGKHYQTIPLKTISYTKPSLSSQKNQQHTRNIKTSRKSQDQNKFNSKNIFTNMKKLQDLRKSNYKKKLRSLQKNENQQKITQSDQMKLDLFQLTSTNFNYKDKHNIDSQQDIQLARKFTQTKQTKCSKKNIIRYNNSTNNPKKSSHNNQIYQNIDQQINSNQPFFILQPVKTQTNFQKNKLKIKENKIIVNKSAKNLSDLRYSLGTVNLVENQENSNRQCMKSFTRYSQATIVAQNQVLKKGIKRLKQFNTERCLSLKQRYDKQHISIPFKASFRIKHIADNKNVLLTVIKKKASSMNKQWLVDFIKKILN